MASTTSTSSTSSSSSLTSASKKPAKGKGPAKLELKAFTTTTTTPTGTISEGKAELKAEGKVTDEQKALLMRLIEMNGYDFYRNQDHALGVIPRSQYLVLPAGIDRARLRSLARNVGDGSIVGRLEFADLAAIYALNKAQCPTTEYKSMYGLIRLEQIKAGWFDDQKEVYEEAVPADAEATFLNDLKFMVDNCDHARTVAFLQPIFAELIFRTTGHHYLSSGTAGSDYRAKYLKLYQASLVADTSNLLPADLQYYAIGHWVSPARSYAVLFAQATGDRIPEAIKVRIRASPAGTAILSTTAAALNIVDIFSMREAIRNFMNVDIDSIDQMVEAIQREPAAFHKTHIAYNRPALTTEDKSHLDHAIKQAQILAPITQAIIDVYASTGALKNAQVLKKHKDQAPVVHARMVKFLRHTTRKTPETFAEVFRDMSVVRPIAATTTTGSTTTTVPSVTPTVI